MHRARRRVGRSLAKKFFIFTATLVFWVIAVMLAYDLRVDTFDASQAALLAIVVVLVSGAIAQFTSRALVRPLSLLRDGIAAVQRGELTLIEVSQTRDEVQFLGESFNQMILALSESQRLIQLRTAELENAIQQAREVSRAQNQLLANLDRALEGGEVANTETLEELETVRSSAESTLALLNQLLEAPARSEPARSEIARSEIASRQG